MKKHLVDDIEMNADQLAEQRQVLIEIRDAAISVGDLGRAFVLSLTIGFLHCCIEELRKEEE